MAKSIGTQVTSTSAPDHSIRHVHCYECHSEQADEVESNLYLDSRAGILAGGESGPPVVPGKLDESLLLEAIGYSGSLKMPPDGKLAKEEIAALTRWVALGAPWPAATAAQASRPVEPALFTLNSGFMIHYSRALAARLTTEPEDDRARILRAYRLVYGREASDAEVDWGLSFLASAEPTELTPHVRKEIEAEERRMMDMMKKSKGEGLFDAQRYQSSGFKVEFEELKRPLSPWDQYAHVLLATNEFMYVD